MPLFRVTHKHVEQACARYNKARKLHYWRAQKPPSVGYLIWQDVAGNGNNRRNLYAITGENGGVCASNLRRATMRKTILAINLAIQADKSQSFALIIRATTCRGEIQRAALDEMQARGLWLSDEQMAQAGLIKTASGLPRQP